MSDKTRWFNARTEPPVHVGYYEVRCWNGAYGAPAYPGERLYWNGKAWICMNDSATRYVAFSFGGPGHDCDSWRGLSI